MFQAVDGDKVWMFSYQVFGGSIPDDRRRWNVVLEFDFWEVSSTPSETCVSWDYAIVVSWDYVPNWGFLLEGCGQCCHSGEEV